MKITSTNSMAHICHVRDAAEKITVKRTMRYRLSIHIADRAM